MCSVKVVGLQQLAGDFALLSKAEGGRVARRAARAGAKVAQKAIKAKARKRTGKMARGVILRSERTRNGVATVSVVMSTKKYMDGDQSKNAAQVANYFEHGTEHIAADPFIRPAFDESEEGQVSALLDEAGAGIDRVLSGAR